ncbi:MAG: hypothetical protein JXM73_21950 [Anaerolineae bacterium]|nr:hypothetical protein [Anaerolineae bacterium]
MINRQGETQGVFLPLAAWEKVLEALEDIEDLVIARDYVTKRARAHSLKEMGLLNWQDVEAEWDDGETTQA